MSGERVDLDDLRTLAMAAKISGEKRGDRPGADGCWSIAPRRDGAVDVVVASSGADVFDRALIVDAAFAVAAQPAVVIALLDRIDQLARGVNDAMIALGSNALPAAANAARRVLAQGVVLR